MELMEQPHVDPTVWRESKTIIPECSSPIIQPYIEMELWDLGLIAHLFHLSTVLQMNLKLMPCLVEILQKEDLAKLDTGERIQIRDNHTNSHQKNPV